MASCSGNGESQKEREDSGQTIDSMAQIEVPQAQDATEGEQTLPDPASQDSIVKDDEITKATAQYDGIIKEYVSTVNSFAKVSKTVTQTGAYSKGVSLLQKCFKQEEKINKIKSKLSPSQLEQFNKAKAKFKKANAPGRYAG